jgi:hypothetical protein
LIYILSNISLKPQKDGDFEISVTLKDGKQPQLAAEEFARLARLKGQAVDVTISSRQGEIEL